MAERPFHHGNLRTVLLDSAETVLRQRGVDELSLRELAREAGVSQIDGPTGADDDFKRHSARCACCNRRILVFME